VNALTVLYDAGCPVCRAARRWLAGRAQLVPLAFVPAGSAEARRRFPGLDHAATLREITVVADTGEVYVGDGAWLACLWALESHRDLAYRLGQPHLLPLARGVVRAASAVREAVRDHPPSADRYGGRDDRAECVDDRCG
jgi:predicted DCC family thiol-disulfide oxidoreductase YuxK